MITDYSARARAFIQTTTTQIENSARELASDVSTATTRFFSRSRPAEGADPLRQAPAALNDTFTNRLHPEDQARIHRDPSLRNDLMIALQNIEAAQRQADALCATNRH
jgi:hypothetical protein